jgi:gamma-carbonic anhydrase
MKIRHRETTPSVNPEAYVAPTAVLSGQVTVGPGSCVLHGAVLSADDGSVEIGANCVIMEHAQRADAYCHAPLRQLPSPFSSRR